MTSRDCPSRADSSPVEHERQAERLEQLGVEGRDLRDAVVLAAQDVALERAELGVAGAAQIARGGGPPIRAGGHQAPLALPLRAERALEQRRDRVAAVEDDRVR